MDKTFLIHKDGDDSFEIEMKNDFSIISSVGCKRCQKRIYKGETYIIIRAGKRGYSASDYTITAYLV